jgi:CubicO group peptidase (beta-lactamase class C family)
VFRAAAATFMGQRLCRVPRRSLFALEELTEHAPIFRGSTFRQPQAAAHATVGGKVSPIGRFDGDNTNPAAGIQSNADDMARWLIVQLARGKLADGSRLFSDSTWQQLTTLVTPMPSTACHRSGKGPRPDFYGCALGLIVRDSRGRKLLTHRVSLPGFVSQIVMVPDADSGSAATRSFGCWVWW